MQAALEIEVCTRLYYDCPAMSPESLEANRFFKKYGGKEAAVVGFDTEYVGPLDPMGRLPGSYYTGGLKVQFDGESEIHEGLNPRHFVVLGPAKVVRGKNDSYAGELPQPILFYPDDVVVETSDLLATPRLVSKVSIGKDGSPLYHLAETADELRVREAAHKESKPSFFGVRFSDSGGKWVEGESLVLLERGNVRALYADPTQLQFASDQAEVNFWAGEGLSFVVGGDDPDDYSFLIGMSLAAAVELVVAEKGDLIVRRNRPREVLYQVRRLHERFDSFREHVRKISAEAEEAPVVDKDLFGGVLKHLKSLV